MNIKFLNVEYQNDMSATRRKMKEELARVTKKRERKARKSHSLDVRSVAF